VETDRCLGGGVALTFAAAHRHPVGGPPRPVSNEHVAQPIGVTGDKIRGAGNVAHPPAVRGQRGRIACLVALPLVAIQRHPDGGPAPPVPNEHILNAVCISTDHVCRCRRERHISAVRRHLDRRPTATALALVAAHRHPACGPRASGPEPTRPQICWCHSGRGSTRRTRKPRTARLPRSHRRSSQHFLGPRRCSLTLAGWSRASGLAPTRYWRYLYLLRRPVTRYR